MILLLLTYVWYDTPVVFLDAIEADDLSSIEVFNGNNGHTFTIVEKEVIHEVVANLQSIPMNRDSISIGRMGTYFTLTCYDNNKKKMTSFIINDESTIRKDPFFYKTNESEFCVDLLESYENGLEEDN